MERFRLVAATHVLLLKDDQVLLLQRKNTGYEDGNYSVPAGHHDAGEPMKMSAIRELQEEAGVTVLPQDLLPGCVMHRVKPEGTESIDYFYLVKTWTGDIVNAEPEKCAELKFFPLDALPSHTIPYIKRGIEASLNGETFVEFGW